MLRPLVVAPLIIVAIAAMSLATTRSERSNASAADFAQVKWGDANCDNDTDTTDTLYMLATFTHYQPQAPASCPRLPMTVSIDDNPYLWGDYDCSTVFDYTDIVYALKNLAGFTASDANPQAITCFEWAQVVEPHFPPPADDSLDLLAIDTLTGGNTATSLGPLNTCLTVAVGDTFTVDVVVKGIPPAMGLIAFDHDFRYDPAVIQYVSNDPYYLISANNGPSHAGITDYTDFGSFGYDLNTGQPIPGTPNGHIYPTVYDYTYATVTPESGDGVLIRYTMRAIANGTSALSLHQGLGNDLYPPTVGGNDFKPYQVPDLRGAEIRVGSDCPGVTATPNGSATPTNTATATPTGTATGSPTATPDPSLSDCPNIEPPKDIDDNVPSGFDFERTLVDEGIIDSMNICLNVAAQWAGDVIVTITHDDGVNPPHTRILIDKVGNGASTCSGNGNGFYVYLSDFPSPVRSLEDACPGGFAGDDFIGEFLPNQPLADDQFGNTFHGETIAGDWTINVSDNQFGGTVQVQGIELHFND